MLIGLIIAAPILLGIVIIIILAVLGPQLAEDSVVAQGLPVYSGARRIELTATDRSIVLKNFEQGLQGSSGGSVKVAYFEVYAIKAADKNPTFSFYDSALKKQSWLGTTGNPTTRGSNTQSIYQKSNSILALFSGKLSASDGPLNNSRYNITSDELVLLVVGTEKSS